jgi:uncharacterized protein YjbI with pentapeptide repeats
LRGPAWGRSARSEPKSSTPQPRGFSSADLREASLSDAYLSGATLTSANLSGADLSDLQALRTALPTAAETPLIEAPDLASFVSTRN